MSCVRASAMPRSAIGYRLPAGFLALALLAGFGCGPGAPPPISTPPEEGAPVRTGHGMVSSANEISSRVGTQVLRSGGNAVDAAIATGLALAVTHPSAGNIGGGGFMVIRFPDGRSTSIDFREKAPLAAHSEMFLDEDGEPSTHLRRRSHLAVGVPGTVAGFAKAHEKYGSMSWARLVEPAVELARDGFPMMPGLARSLRNTLSSMEHNPASMAAFSRDGEPYEEGEIWKQPDLARTLERIKTDGHDGFYGGETAQLIAAEMEQGEGFITLEDLARYKAVERTPIRCVYRDHEVISMGPPSSGGVALVQMLNILEGYDLAALGHNSPSYLHHLAEAMRLAYRDRARYLGDPDYVDVPVQRLTSKDYGAELREGIDPRQAGVSSPSDVELAPESEETTHYSVVDAKGMAVSVTYTLEQSYGSRITVTGAGFLLNNEMGDFNPKPGRTTTGGLIGTDPNLVRPEQRMLSSMTPTILVRDREFPIVIGTPGGRTIINTVLQITLNLVDFGMDIQQAVDAPRIHHQWLPDRIRIERALADDDLLAALEAMGHTTSVAGTQGAAHSVMVDAVTGERLGAPDGRGRDAGAVGY